MRPFLLLFCVAIMSSCGCPHRFIPSDEPDPLPCFKVPEKIRVALVLGSGGVRGIAHVGVIEELVNADVPIDLIVGCSAGSIVGAIYADNPCVDDLMQAVWKMRSHSIVDFDIWNCRFGLSQGTAMMRVIDEDLNSDTFEDLQIPLIVVASDLHSGELVPMGSGDLVKAVRASCSIPFVFVPVDYMGRVLVDGGVVCPVPVDVAHDLGADIIIAVDLAEMLDKTFPTNLLGVALRSAEIAFVWQNQDCTENAHVVIRPKTCGVGAFNDKMKRCVYEAGKEATRKALPEILELLKKHNIELSDEIEPKEREVTLESYAPNIYL